MAPLSSFPSFGPVDSIDIICPVFISRGSFVTLFHFRISCLISIRSARSIISSCSVTPVFLLINFLTSNTNPDKQYADAHLLPFLTANLQTTVPSIQPTQSELAEMTHHAAEVVRLLELLKDERPSSYALPQIPQAQPHPLSGQIQPSTSPQAMDVDTHDHRAPKRPWEEDAPEAVDSKRAHSTVHDPAALQDMELIRSKRALTASLAAAAASGDGIGGPSSANGGNNANVGSGVDGGLGNGNMSGNGGGKNKYRKRSRATPPGKCHSCNIRETPEWRRGPDGARTLCNACGLHYAKLVRKRDKAAAADGNAPARIDMETLRASARAAESEKAARSGSGGGGGDPMMGMGMVHQGSFQIMGMGTGGPEGDHHAQYPNSTTQPQPQPPAALPSHHVSDHPHPSLPAWTGSHSLLRPSHSVSASSGPSPA
ncbi:hypothetical protein BJ138DRAFT_31729 [Hygrophoropsis aurantiaca]|uniref:Uncharacterized protein n=1 Tax=Hygrophoropsis aurantiaca TaxID=72124 RepID=A0ACB8ACP8_9AGAM|nr:hypothetical protein BJ138DRAFT_31729 [Hygrophoropsis aurantiaca]